MSVDSSIFCFGNCIVFALYILKLFKLSIMVTTECRRHDKFRKSSVDTKTSGRKFYKKGMYSLKTSPHKFLLIAKGKNNNFLGNNLVDTTLTKW